MVRHGQTPTTGVILPGRAPGLHLADEGRRQADAVAARVRGLAAVAAVYASPLERARETAAPIAEARALAVDIDPDLADCDSGEWTGQELKILRERPEWAVVQREPSAFRFPGGESFPEVLARITGVLARLVARHQGHTVVAVSHADPIRVAVGHAMGAPLDHFQRVMVSPGSVTALACPAGYPDEGALVLAVNSTEGALAPLLPA